MSFNLILSTNINFKNYNKITTLVVQKLVIYKYSLATLIISDFLSETIPIVEDWSIFTSLKVHVYNPDTKINLRYIFVQLIHSLLSSNAKINKKYFQYFKWYWSLKFLLSHVLRISLFVDIFFCINHNIWKYIRFKKVKHCCILYHKSIIIKDKINKQFLQ